MAFWHHPCDHPSGCSEWGTYGYGPLRKSDLVKWRCKAHRIEDWTPPPPTLPICGPPQPSLF